MRLFTAIELDDEVRDAAAREQQRIRSAIGDRSQSLRFVKRDHLHVTMVFLGEIEESRVAAIVRSMDMDVAQPPFHLAIGGIGTFPPRGRPHVVWLAVRQGERETIALHGMVAARLSSVGVVVEPRPFHPHVTLARAKDRRGAGQLRLPDPGETVASQRVEQVTLFQSRLSPAGPTYTALARAHLK
jgi:2'-5' RNA ligase